MSNEDGRKVELCGLWENETTSGDKYWSGALGGAKVLVFKNKYKGENQKAPDLKVYLVPAEKKGGRAFVKKGPEKVVDALDGYNGFTGETNDYGF